MLWNRDEADILEEVVTDAARQVDQLFVADSSSDGSWEILQSVALRAGNIVVQRENETHDRAQRNSLLAKIRARYRAEDTWVQVFESDVFTLDTDIRTAIREYAIDDVAVSWFALNACRLSWEGADMWPRWDRPIREVMPLAHYMETMTYTFRPLEGLYFEADRWRPWPRGFSRYTSAPIFVQPCGPSQPLLLHVGYRGPTHFWRKYRHMGERHTKYTGWRLDSPETVAASVSYFNGVWNGEAFPATRAGWLSSTYGGCSGSDSCDRYHGRPDRAAHHHRQQDGVARAAEAGPLGV